MNLYVYDTDLFISERGNLIFKRSNYDHVHDMTRIGYYHIIGLGSFSRDRSDLCLDHVYYTY